MLEEVNILERHDFGDVRARYEEATKKHHDHLIDVKSGKVIEFQNDEIERLQREVAAALGYRLVGHRLELFAVSTDIGETAAEKAKTSGTSGNSDNRATPGDQADQT